MGIEEITKFNEQISKFNQVATKKIQEFLFFKKKNSGQSAEKIRTFFQW